MIWLQVPWCKEAETALADALCGDGDYIREEVEQGIAQLYRVKDHGFVVIRIEQFAEERELVLVSWAGRDTGPIVEHVQKRCREQGIKTIRFHTELKPEVVNRFVKKWGFKPVETVYKWVA